MYIQLAFLAFIECLALYPSALDSLKKASWIQAASRSLAGKGKKRLANKRSLVLILEIFAEAKSELEQILSGILRDII